MTKEAKILIGIAVVVLIGGVLLAIYGNPQPEQASPIVDKNNLIRENNFMTGSKDAKVTMVEFADFQCPACGAASPIVKEILAEYKDNPNFNFVFKHFPLTDIHPNAQIASQAAEAAKAQGKFLEMDETLYARQSEWSTLPDPLDMFAKYAGELQLDVERFKSEVSQRKYSEIISADVQDATGAGVNSTPTFFINGVKYNRVMPKDELKSIIDAELVK